MAEVYTCRCGNQRWIIYGVMIECSACKEKFTLVRDIDAYDFNKKRREVDANQETLDLDS